MPIMLPPMPPSGGFRPLPPAGESTASGELLNWKEQGWGQLACLSLNSGTIFAHKSDFVEEIQEDAPPIGKIFTFTIGTDKKSGKPRALRIEEHRTVRSSGTIDKWDPAKSCGFISSDGRRVFAHKSNFRTQFD